LLKKKNPNLEACETQTRHFLAEFLFGIQWGFPLKKINPKIDA
jgi:hypothetical protein